MTTSTRFASVKSFLIQAAAGVAAAAVAALLAAPDQQIHLGTLAMGLIALPLFLLAGASAVFLYGLYLVIHVVEVVATKLHIIDMIDAG